MAMGYGNFQMTPPGVNAGMMNAMPQSMPYLPNYSPMQPPSAPQQNVNWLYVNGLQGAREHIVQPGRTAGLMDNNAPVIYVKAVDAVGTSTLRIFRLMEISPDQAAPAAPQAEAQYATREEVAALSQRLDKLVDEIGGLNA